MNPLHTHTHNSSTSPLLKALQTMKTPVCKQQLSPEKSSSVCVCLCGFVVVWKHPKVNLKIAQKQGKKRISVNIFCPLSSSQFFSLPFQVLFLPDCVHLLIDNWLQSHSGLLKYQAGASGFRPRPRAPLLSASGRLAPLEPIPVSPIQPACFVYLHLSRLLLPTGPRLGGADGVSTLTRTWQLGRETGRQHTDPGACRGSHSQESSLSDAAHSSFVPYGVGSLFCLLQLHKLQSWVVCRGYDGFHYECVNGRSSHYIYFPRDEWVFGRRNWISTIVTETNPLQFLFTVQILNNVYVLTELTRRLTDMATHWFHSVLQNNVNSLHVSTVLQQH